jgi:hypothetical protein
MNIPKRLLIAVFSLLALFILILALTTDWRLIFVLTAAVPIFVVFQTIAILKHPQGDQPPKETYNEWYEKK